MPWLIRDQEEPSENLFFVHVPRCGGTSLTQHFDVPKKSRQGRNCFGKFGMIYFFYRYKLLESANFPVKTWENLIACVYLTLSITFFVLAAFILDRNIPIPAYTFLAAAVFTFTFSTFIATAPLIGRVWWIRRPYLVLIHYVLFRFMESIRWCTGTNVKGYMMHLTAQKLLKYGYVTAEEMESVCSMAIVRNPYSRMVSVYMYNRFGPAEKFSGFCRRWYKMMRYYRERGEMEEWWTPCHGIPQFEYTHFEGKQLVQSVVKQEELKYLKTESESQALKAMDSSVADLPQPVRKALLGMPHTNKRKTGIMWWDYFDQETLNLTYEMYQDDFTIFDYSPKLDKRPDLTSPEPEPVKPEIQRMSRNSLQRGDSLKAASFVGHLDAKGSRSRELKPAGSRMHPVKHPTMPTIVQGSESNASAPTPAASIENDADNVATNV